MGIGLPRWLSGRTKVYVDAKILNMHDPFLEKETYVGYLVQGGTWNARRVEAAESDDAEVLAVLFAITDLKGRFGRLTIVCDHESVVSEANRKDVKSPSELMRQLREALQESRGSVELEVLQANPAHRIVTEYVNSTRATPVEAQGPP